MSRENVDTVRRLFAYWEQGEWQASAELFDPDFEAVFSSGAFPDPGTYRGARRTLQPADGPSAVVGAVVGAVTVVMVVAVMMAILVTMMPRVVVGAMTRQGRPGSGERYCARHREEANRPPDSPDHVFPLLLVCLCRQCDARAVGTSIGHQS
jgi:hypothetical protein